MAKRDNILLELADRLKKAKDEYGYGFATALVSELDGLVTDGYIAQIMNPEKYNVKTAPDKITAIHAGLDRMGLAVEPNGEGDDIVKDKYIRSLEMLVETLTRENENLRKLLEMQAGPASMPPTGTLRK